MSAFLALILLADRVPGDEDSDGIDVASGEADAEPAFRVWARGELWYAIPTGQLVITRGSRPGSGTVVRLGEDFGLRPEAVPGGELGASLDGHRVRVSYLDLRFSGTENPDENLIFHGRPYPAGEQVRADVDLPRLSFCYDYDVWDTSWTSFRVGLVGHVYWFTARLTSATEDESRTYSHGAGALAMSVQAKAGPVLIDVDGSLGYSVSSHEFFGGVRLLAGLRLWGPLEAALGYRWDRMDSSGGTNLVALTLHGPTVALTLRF